MAWLGLDWATLHATNPRLVVGSISGYGPDGPMADAPAIDGVVQAFVGAFGLPQVYGLDPMPVPMTIADLAAGSITANGVISALTPVNAPASARGSRRASGPRDPPVAVRV